MRRGRSAAERAYTSHHWGISPTRRIYFDEPGFPDDLTQMGELNLLVIEPAGSQDFEPYELSFEVNPSSKEPVLDCHVAFDLSRAKRCWFILSDRAKRHAVDLFHERGGIRGMLNDCQRTWGGFQAKTPYSPDHFVKVLGQCPEIQYVTEKGEDGESTYQHHFGEESGHKPLICVDQYGRLFTAGGNYRTLVDGITD